MWISCFMESVYGVVSMGFFHLSVVKLCRTGFLFVILFDSRLYQ